MRDIRIAAAQFEARDADKEYNLGRIEALARQAADQGAEIVSFHECSITGYTFLQTLSRDALWALAEPVPEGPSTERLFEMARKLRVAILAGLVEARRGAVAQQLRGRLAGGLRGQVPQAAHLHQPAISRRATSTGCSTCAAFAAAS